MAQTFAQGQAPWEIGQSAPPTFQQGQAPWEQAAPTPTKQDTLHSIGGGIVHDLVKNGPSEILGALKSGLSQTGQGFLKMIGIVPETVPFEGMGQTLSGAVNTLGSPLAPVANRTIGPLISPVLNSIDQGALKLGGVPLQAAVRTAGNFANFAAATGGIKAPAVLKSAAKAVTNTAHEMLSGVSKSLQDSAVNDLQSTYQDIFDATKAGMKRSDKAAAITAAKNSAGTIGRTPDAVLAQARIIPKLEGTKYSTFDQAQKFKHQTAPLSQALDEGLKQATYSVPPTPIEALKDITIARIQSNDHMTAGERVTLIKEVESEYTHLQNRYGDSIDLLKQNIEKSNYWNPAFKGSDSAAILKKDANYQIAKTFQENIQTQAENAGFSDIAQLNREIGDRLEAAKALESINGNTVKYGRLGKIAAITMGASLGHSIPGKLVGAIGGEMVAQLLIDNSVASPVKRLLLKSIEQQHPEAYTALIKWLEAEHAMNQLRPQLPSPSPLGSDANPIITPAPTTYEAPAQQIAPTLQSTQ